MRDGVLEETVPPLAKRPKRQSLGAISINGFKRALWFRLKKSFEDKESWVKAASRIPIYKHSKDVARFLLVVASEDAAPDPAEPGLVVKGTKGFAPTIQTKAWKDDLNFSVEHIAPQAKNGGWSEALYDDPQTIDRLGNLILLPSQVNAYLGSRSWEQKRLLYRYFSSDTPADAEVVASSFGPAGLTISETGKEILGSSKYMPMCKAIARVGTEWSVQVIEKRGVRLAELVFDRVVDWLSPKQGSDWISEL